jgi:5-methylcytosine-specific restriction endonuclease McrA
MSRPGVVHTPQYIERLRSKEWRCLRLDLIERNAFTCQRCCRRPPDGIDAYAFFDVHHKHYDTLGHEQAGDLEVLCKDCHRQADMEREAEAQRRASEALYGARLDGWASKVYGEDWEDSCDPDQVEEEFDAWVERQDDQWNY